MEEKSKVKGLLSKLGRSESLSKKAHSLIQAKMKKVGVTDKEVNSDAVLIITLND